MPQTEVSTFASLLGHLAAGAFSGRDQATQENAAEQQQAAQDKAQQQYRDQQLGIERQRLTDQEATEKQRGIDVLRNRAAGYATGLRTMLSDPNHVSYFHSTGALPGIQAEHDRAMRFSLGQGGDQWQPAWPSGSPELPPAADTSPGAAGQLAPAAPGSSPAGGLGATSQQPPQQPPVPLPALGMGYAPSAAPAPPPLFPAAPAASPAAPAPGFSPRAELNRMLAAGPPQIQRQPYETDAAFERRQADAEKRWHDQVAVLGQSAAAEAKATTAAETAKTRGVTAAAGADLKRAQAEALRTYAPLRDRAVLDRIRHTHTMEELEQAKIDLQRQHGQQLIQAHAKENAARHFQQNIGIVTDPKKWSALDPAGRTVVGSLLQQDAQAAGLKMPAGALERILNSPVIDARRSAKGKFSPADTKIYAENSKVLSATLHDLAGTRPRYSPAERQRALSILRGLTEKYGGDPSLLPDLGLPATPRGRASSTGDGYPSDAPGAGYTPMQTPSKGPKPYSDAWWSQVDKQSSATSTARSGTPGAGIREPTATVRLDGRSQALTKSQLWGLLTQRVQRGQATEHQRNTIIERVFPSRPGAATGGQQRGALPPEHHAPYLAALVRAGARPEEIAHLIGERFGGMA